VVCLVLVAAIAACAAPNPSPSDSEPATVVTIDPAASPRLRVDQVEAIALVQIHGMEQAVGYVVRPAHIVSVSATTGGRWRVVAEGTFTNTRTPPRASPGVASSGYFVIDDATGGVIGFGYP
jgi:hypothetical protein